MIAALVSMSSIQILFSGMKSADPHQKLSDHDSHSNLLISSACQHLSNLGVSLELWMHISVYMSNISALDISLFTQG